LAKAMGQTDGKWWMGVLKNIDILVGSNWWAMVIMLFGKVFNHSE
jgi:hypothetical protein